MPEALRQLRIANKPGPGPADPLSDLTDDHRRQIGRRLALLQTWRNMCRDFEAAGRTVTEATQAFLLAHPEISQRTLYRWDKRHRDDGIIGLIDGRSKANQLPVSADQAISEEAWRYFLSLYLTIQRRMVALCHQMTAEKARDQGWQWPSLRSVQLRVAQLPATQTDYFRLGEREWRRRHEPKLARDYRQYRSNEWWVGDFHEFDVFCRRSESDPTIVRPLLSAFIDLRSRLLVGWHVTLRESQDAVLLAFRDGVNKWGPPWHAVVDNGKPYKALGVSGGRPRACQKIQNPDYVRSVFGGLNVAVHFSIPFNPDSKLIERWFGTLEAQFGATFDTYCGGQKDNRFRIAWKLAYGHPEKCPTVAELDEKFAAYLEAYHLAPHTGDGMDGLSPSQAFERFDPIPRAVAPDGAMDLLLMRTTKPAKAGRLGVQHNGIRYGATDPRLQRLHGQKVILRVHPTNASYVVVCDLGGKPLFRAANNRLELYDVGQDHIAEGMKAKKRAKQLARQIQEGALRPIHDDVATAAIRARYRAGERAAQQLAATGTDDVPPRNFQPLRSDFADAVERFDAQATPAAPDAPPFTWADMDDSPGEAEADSGEDLGPISLAELDE